MSSFALVMCAWSAAGAAVVVATFAWRATSTRLEEIARAAHELRGPITAARLGVELGTRVGELTRDELAEFVERAWLSRAGPRAIEQWRASSRV